MPKPPLPPPQSPAAETVVGYQIGEQGANQRVWQKIVKVTDAYGNFTFQTNKAYVELAGGLNYANPVTGQWLPSKEEIDAYPGGAIAQYGQYKVIFGNNLNTAGAIDLQTLDGQELKSHVLGLSYYDTASGKTVLIAEIQDCQGQIAGSNQVIFADAFEGVSGSVQYIYRRGSFEQNVILQSQPPTPESYGLNSVSTMLQVLTEFDAAPAPMVTTITNGSAATLPDELLNFGTMRMIPGRAFTVGQNPLAGVRVGKQWLNVNGRTILVESVPVSAISNQLSQLPVTQVAQVGTDRRAVPTAPKAFGAVPTPKSLLNVASTRRLLPAPKLAQATKATMKLASSRPTTGLVLDYVTITSSFPGDFQSDTTYYVTGPVYISGTLTLEGGTVIKYAENAGSGITAGGNVNCQTSLYRPVIITSKNDDSAGEMISGSSHHPGTINCPALTFDTGSSLLGRPVEFLHIRYASVGLIYRDGTTPLRHCQFVNVINPIQATVSPLTVENNLFDGASGTVFSGGVFNAAHLTVHSAAHLVATGATLNVVNSIFSRVSDVDGVTLGPTCVRVGDESPFTHVQAGYFYVNDVAYKTGTSVISADLETDFKKMTTYPPTPEVNQTISSPPPPPWNQTVARETGYPYMLGYHYPALDYLVSQVNVQNTTLTLGPGVAVGVYGARGLWSWTAGILISQGTPLVHNQLCYYPAVQEQPLALGIGELMEWQGWDPPASLNAQFTDFNGMSGSSYLAWGYSFQIQLRDCYIGPGNFSPNSPPPSCNDGITNNLFERATFGIGCNDFMCPVYFYNNTFINSTVQIDVFWAPPSNRTIKDNLFDNCTVNVAYPIYVDYGHNAYSGGTTTLTLHDGDFQANVVYATGPLGNRYIGSASPTLVDAGSRSSSAAGLSTYTILPYQTADSGPVDIGFHYSFLAAIRPGFTNNILDRNDDDCCCDVDGDGRPQYSLLPNLLATIGFPINFYGPTYTTLEVNNNGNVTFTDVLCVFTPKPLAAIVVENPIGGIIAPFWADVDTRAANSGLVTYGTSTVDGRAAFGVTWPNFGYYTNDDKLNSFQMVLINRSDRAIGDFDLEFNYSSVQWEAGNSSGGCDGLWIGGTPDNNCVPNTYGYPARAGFARADVSTFEIDGSAIPSAFLDINPSTGSPNTATGLIYHNFNSIVPGRYVFQFHNGWPLATP